MHHVLEELAERAERINHISSGNSPLHRDEWQEEAIGTEGRRQLFLGTV